MASQGVETLPRRAAGASVIRRAPAFRASAARHNADARSRGSAWAGTPLPSIRRKGASHAASGRSRPPFHVQMHVRTLPQAAQRAGGQGGPPARRRRDVYAFQCPCARIRPTGQGRGRHS
jgi:hypothetical protein